MVMFSPLCVPRATMHVELYLERADDSRAADASTSGGINRHADHWVQNICTSAWTKDWVQHGFPLFWDSARGRVPAQQRKNHSGAYEFAEQMDKALQAMLEGGAAREWEGHEPPTVVLPLNVIAKRQAGKYRVLLDGRPVNEHLYCPSFKYEKLGDLEHIMQPGELMVGIDLANGYWQLRMATAAHEFLGFEWRGKYYVFTVLPFGIRTAPWGFSKLMREFCAYLRGKGYRVINYLDDFLFLLGTNRAAAERARDALLREFEAAGLGLNLGKCQLVPVQRLRCLGYMVDSSTMTFEVPEDRWAAFQAAVAAVQTAGPTAPARWVARVAGHAVSLHLVVGKLGRLFTRACVAALAARRDWETRVPVTPELREELAFWASMPREQAAAPIRASPQTTALTINTDASDFGWAGVLNGATVAHGYLQPAERLTSSACRELLAVLYTLQSLEDQLQGQRVHVLTDSTNNVSIVEHGSGREHLQELSLRIFWWCKQHSVRLSISWIPRELNTVADCFSKLKEGCDWKLDPQWFRVLDARWGPHTVDRFASSANAQCPRFNALYHCPGVEAVDCFTQDWKGENNWCNPPFGLVARLWSFMREQGIVATVIIPVWRSATWWPLVCMGGAWSPAVVDVLPLQRGRHLFLPGVAAANQFGVGAPNWDVVAVRVSFEAGWQRRGQRPWAQ